MYNRFLMSLEIGSKSEKKTGFFKNNNNNFVNSTDIKFA